MRLDAVPIIEAVCVPVGLIAISHRIAASCDRVVCKQTCLFLVLGSTYFQKCHLTTHKSECKEMPIVGMDPCQVCAVSDCTWAISA